MKKQIKRTRLLFLFTCVLLSCTIMASCGDNGEDDPQQGNVASIVGKWVDGEDTITFGSNGSYREDGSLGQYRIGTYSYNPTSSLLVTDIKAVAGMNSAYQQTYIVQTLTATNLVLLYTDGDVKGYYTRQ